MCCAYLQWILELHFTPKCPLSGPEQGLAPTYIEKSITSPDPAIVIDLPFVHLGFSKLTQKFGKIFPKFKQMVYHSLEWRPLFGINNFAQWEILRFPLYLRIVWNSICIEKRQLIDQVFKTCIKNKNWNCVLLSKGTKIMQEVFQQYFHQMFDGIITWCNFSSLDFL